jgi:hypothetical protein
VGALGFNQLSEIFDRRVNLGQLSAEHRDSLRAFRVGGGFGLVPAQERGIFDGLILFPVERADLGLNFLGV